MDDTRSNGGTQIAAGTTPISGTGAGTNAAGTNGAGTGGTGFGGAGPRSGGPAIVTDGAMFVHGDAGSGIDEPPVCDSAEIVPTVKMVRRPGNVLIVFDRSGSMDNNWAGPNAKWIDARQAVTDALTPLQADLAAVGALLFPRGEGNENECSVDPIANQFPFQTGPNFLQNWAAYWMQPNVNPGGATPLLVALQEADAALFPGGMLNPLLMNTTVVIVITDGQPNCSAGGGSNSDEPLGNLTPLPMQWLMNDIKTYVIGVPDNNLGQGGITILDGVAQAGGTDQHIPANDPAALQAEIASIVEDSVLTGFPCEINVDPPPENPDDVRLVVTENGTEFAVDQNIGGMQAWTINADGTHIMFHGDFCAAVMSGAYENVAVRFGCVSLPPLPPPKPD
jgi:hypothetical protein